MAARSELVVRSSRARLPLFLPVYQKTFGSVAAHHWREYEIEGCIVNAFFLYKQRDLRRQFADGLTVKDHIGFGGLVMTDSGAYQGFTRQLYLDNRKIVRFQEEIGADIVSPLDLVTPPGDSRTVATKKMEATLRRVREAEAALRDGTTLAAVQQGGRFLDLRRQSVEALVDAGVRYLALGSLVPFFARNHDLRFIRRVLEDARATAGPDVPIHIFGAGDPVELPFLVAWGADVFDSSSYAHYARGGWYMTPYGALASADDVERHQYQCGCTACAAKPLADLWADEDALRAHNLATVMGTISRVRAAIDDGTLDHLLRTTLERHMDWRGESMLRTAVEAATGC